MVANGWVNKIATTTVPPNETRARYKTVTIIWSVHGCRVAISQEPFSASMRPSF